MKLRDDQTCSDYVIRTSYAMRKVASWIARDADRCREPGELEQLKEDYAYEIDVLRHYERWLYANEGLRVDSIHTQIRQLFARRAMEIQTEKDFTL